MVKFKKREEYLSPEVGVLNTDVSCALCQASTKDVGLNNVGFEEIGEDDPIKW